MILDFAPASYLRDTGLSESRLVGLFPELTPGGPGKSARLSRPGLVAAYSLGDSGIRGVYRQDGVFGGDLFAVCGTKLFRGEMEIGTVALGPVAKFAASPSQFVVVVGGAAHCYGGDTLEEIDVDGKRVVDVVLVGDRFYFLVEEDDEWYFSDIDDATTVNNLAFATADAKPDASVGAVVQSDQVVFFGRTSVEFWHQTGDADAPLIRAQGSTYTRGCLTGRSIVQADNRAFWVGDDLKVYTLGAPDRVSTHAVEEDLRLCTDKDGISGWSASWNGHDFVGFNVPGRRTWVLHIESGQWAEWSSYGRETFRCASAAMVGGTPYLGDSISGTIFRLDTAYTDAGEPLERLASCFGPAGAYYRVELVAAFGVGLEDGTDPTVEACYSDDRGRTWSAWRQMSLGKIGDYEHRAFLTRLGQSKRGRVFMFRCTDPVKVTFVACEADVR